MSRDLGGAASVVPPPAAASATAAAAEVETRMEAVTVMTADGDEHETTGLAMTCHATQSHNRGGLYTHLGMHLHRGSNNNNHRSRVEGKDTSAGRGGAIAMDVRCRSH